MNQAMIIDIVNTKQKRIAITFDDGPDPVYTPQVLEVLSQHGAKATFYTIGESLDQHPELALAAHQAGHEIANHTLTHPHLTELSPEEIRRELSETEQRIVRITGEKPVTIRPPYIAWNEAVAEIAGEFGCALIGAANPAAADWDMPGVDHIVEKTLEAAQCGAIMMFHDGWGDRSQTVEALKIILPKLNELGYQLVSTKQLLASERN